MRVCFHSSRLIEVNGSYVPPAEGDAIGDASCAEAGTPRMNMLTAAAETPSAPTRLANCRRLIVPALNCRYRSLICVPRLFSDIHLLLEVFSGRHRPTSVSTHGRSRSR